MSSRDTLRIHDWDEWQSYRKDRGQPPWIKVHRCLMRNIKWVALSDAERGQLVAIWLLAADHNGVIPASPSLVQKLCFMEAEPDLQLFIRQGFIEHDASVTPSRRQHDQPEKNRGEENRSREEENRTPSRKSKKPKPKPEDEPIPDGIDTTAFRSAWAEWLADRRERGKPMTARAAKMHLRELNTLETPNDAIRCIELAINRGWQGIKADWYRNAIAGNGRVSGQQRDADGQRLGRVEAKPGKYDHLPGGRRAT